MECPVISTLNGKVKGAVVHLKCTDAKPVYTYRSIPFAKPPVGNLRFMPPQPAEPWDGVLDGTAIGNIPMQRRKFEAMMLKITPQKWPVPNDQVAMDEDCLHFSIYTPHPEEGKKLPVMVWLHGGGFSIGSETSFDGSALAGMNDVVVVVPNARLNVFGFFTLGEPSICPGNAGLWDQTMALKWIRDNIGAFGGDCNNVTIFGQSSGGAAVNHHVISPASRGLFHKAISQSGQSTMPKLLFSKTRTTRDRKALLEYLNIEEQDDEKVLEALQKLPASEILKAYDELSSKNVNYCPNMDGKFLVKMPKECLADKDFAKVPYIMGFNNTEAYGLYSVMTGPAFAAGLTEEQAKNAIFLPKNDDLFEAWKEFYVKDQDDPLRFSKLYGDVMADAMYVEPAITTASVHAEAGCDVYMYQGAFQLRFNHDDEFGKDVMKKVDWCKCDHGDEIPLIFGFPFTPGELPHGAKFSDEEAELSRKIMTYYTNFAKYGDPNKGGKVEMVWPKYSPGGEHLIIDHQFKIEKNLSPDKVEYWSKTVPELKKQYPVEE